jgi:hypothetical protein
VEIRALLWKSLALLGQLQNLAQVWRRQEEGGRAHSLVDPPHRFRGVARVHEEILRIPLAEDVVDHLPM